MEDLDVNKHLVTENLFGLFAAQLKKDFEGAGANSDFTDNLPQEFEALKTVMITQMNHILNSSSSLLNSLFYRIDISEIQIHNYQTKNPTLGFEESLAELIIKRILQKVIFKKTFSK